MSEWKPEVLKIEKLQKHPNADSLDVATINGDYHVIVRTGDFQTGDLVAYIPIDTVLPDTEEFYFLTPNNIVSSINPDGTQNNVVTGKKYELGSVPKKRRIISAKKIRGIYSTGLLMNKPEFLNEGDSIVEHFKLEKLDDEDVEIYGSSTGINKRFVKNEDPAYENPPKDWSLPYYDIESVRKYYSKVLENLDEEVIICEKLHGCSASYTHDGTRLFVKSRNNFKSDRSYNLWQQVAQRFEIAEKIKAFPMYAFFGEVYGQQKNKAGQFLYDTQIENGGLQLRFRVFDVYNISTKKYLDYDKMVEVVNQCGLDLVPCLYRGKMPSKTHLYAMAEGSSTLNPKTVREGIVLRTAKERYEIQLDGRCQLKLIGEGYTLKK